MPQEGHAIVRNEWPPDKSRDATVPNCRRGPRPSLAVGFLFIESRRVLPTRPAAASSALLERAIVRHACASHNPHPWRWSLNQVTVCGPQLANAASWLRQPRTPATSGPGKPCLCPDVSVQSSSSKYPSGQAASIRRMASAIQASTLAASQAGRRVPGASRTRSAGEKFILT